MFEGYHSKCLSQIWRMHHVKNLVHRSELDTVTHLCRSQFWQGHGILCGANATVLYRKQEQFHHAMWSDLKQKLFCLASFISYPKYSRSAFNKYCLCLTALSKGRAFHTPCYSSAFCRCRQHSSQSTSSMCTQYNLPECFSFCGIRKPIPPKSMFISI